MKGFPSRPIKHIAETGSFYKLFIASKLHLSRFISKFTPLRLKITENAGKTANFNIYIPVIDGEEIIPAGRSNWLHFVWLSLQQDQQRRVYLYIRGQSQPYRGLHND